MTARSAEGIRRAVDDYAYSIDRRDDALYSTLWTSNATFRIFEYGTAVLTRTMAQILGTPGRMARFVSTMHSVVAHRSSVNGSRAIAETDCRATHIRSLADGSCLNYEVGLRYHDVLVEQQDGRWLFASRDLHLLWGTTAPAVVRGIFDALDAPPQNTWTDPTGRAR